MEVYLVVNKSSMRWGHVLQSLGALNITPLGFNTFELNKPASVFFVSYFIPNGVKLEELPREIDPRSFAMLIGASWKISGDEVYMIMEKDSVLYGAHFVPNTIEWKSKKAKSIKEILNEKKQVLIPYDYQSYLDILFHIGFLFTEVYDTPEGIVLTDFKEGIFEKFKKFFNIDKDKYIVWCPKKGLCGFKEISS